MMPKYINLGCGTRFHSLWINVDISANDPCVVVSDVLKGIPFPDNSFDAVYHSHLLEHFHKNDALPFMRECYRVTKPGGHIRVVVPDLEGITRQYLATLELAIAGHENAEAKYDWMMLELFDQTVREISGGEMAKALSSPCIRNDPFVRSRFGAEVDAFDRPQVLAKWSWREQLRPSNWPGILRRRRIGLALSVVQFIVGSGAVAALSHGLFRQSGEVHKWMYDRLSLDRILAQAGFVGIRQCTADESCIPDFNSYQLDVIDGRIRKPDSLYMEASKLP